MVKRGGKEGRRKALQKKCKIRREAKRVFSPEFLKLQKKKHGRKENSFNKYKKK